MESLIDWAAQYSAPILVLLCIAAATIFVLKIVTERTIEAKFSQMQKTIELSLERRSEFEQRVLLDRYQLIVDILARLERISTDVNRARWGQHIEGLYVELNGRVDIPAITAVYQDLQSKAYLLSPTSRALLREQAATVIDIANAPSDEEYKRIAARYLQNHSRLMELINEEFGTTAIKW